MKKLFPVLAMALAGSLLAAGPAAGQQAYAAGQVTLTVHSHSGGTLLFPVQRLPFNFTQGDTFAYSSRLCSASAPFNEIGLNFIPDYPGVDDDGDGTAPSRHWVQGTVTLARGTVGMIQGKITSVLCVPGPSGTNVESAHTIVSNFQARYELRALNDLHLTGGFQFSPTESTGTFRDLRGGGTFEARLTCLGSSSCAPNGFFNDFVVSSGNPNLPAGQLQPGMFGSYYDPTILPVG
jgi:hypothetical protein